MSVPGLGGDTPNNKVTLGVLTDIPLSLPTFLGVKKSSESTTSFN